MVEALLVVLDELVVESLQPVALKEAVGGLPVPVAMVDVVAIALVVVAHLVPFDVEVLPSGQRQVGREQRVVVDGQGERLDVGVEDLLRLRVKSEEGRVKNKKAQENGAENAPSPRRGLG